MISLYFGLPGAGKSSFITWLIFDYLIKMDSNKCPYQRIYTTCDVNIPDDRVLLMEYDWLYKYDLGARSLIILDEAQKDLFSRNYKSFTSVQLALWSQHRRYQYDIITVTQRFDCLDITVRSLTANVYYLKKSQLFPHFSHVYPVGYGIHIPRQKDEDSPHFGEILQGYYRWGIFKRLFHTRFYRKPFYAFYDSFCRPSYPPIPQELIKRAQRLILPSEPFPITLREKLLHVIRSLKKRFFEIKKKKKG